MRRRLALLYVIGIGLLAIALSTLFAWMQSM
jgi:hypothetical protein